MSTIESADGRMESLPSSEFDHRVRYDPSASGSLSVTVAAAVGEALDTDPMAVAPLYRSVDPDALDSLFVESNVTAEAQLSFVHDGCSVTVRGDGDVLVTVLDD
ncbi:HalOD1 output domain-containing protein [Halomarina oriensis]|uniref:Halobacterial output domain-containing protein n=1 Tax=Halomarina oriensis TaxID=671145 RepID=A0A6B0GSM8_9EURY|nr:HalOD1 output domain-containing protein [Halomarina oriensis]MWG36709.1 hypothetical protein [Halomarina oriensis]